MENNFDLKKFLTENKLTSNSRLLEDFDFDFTAADDVDQYDADFGDDDDDDSDDSSDGDDSQDPNKFDDQRTIPAWKAVKTALQGEKGRLLSFINFTTDDRQETLNWGTTKEAGHSIGVSVGMDDDFKYMEVTTLYHSAEDEAVMNNTLKGLEKYKTYEGQSSSIYKIPANEASKLIEPVKAAAALATASKTIADKGSFGDLGNKTGPVGPGPAIKQAGSVKVGGKPFTGR
jgi:hypothetical protein